MSTKYPRYEKYDQYKKKRKPGMWERFVAFYKNARRILKVANKPNKKEYWLIFKICCIGLIVLGVLSYVIQLVFTVALIPYITGE